MDRSKTTPLHLAAENGHAAVVGILLASRADVDALAVTSTDQSTTRTSALWAARRGEHTAVVDTLVAAGAREVAQTEHVEGTDSSAVLV